MANKNKRSLENGGKRERANAAKAANARERNIAKHYFNAGPNIINLAKAAYHWYNSVPWLGGQNESGLIINKGDVPTPGMRSPKAIVKSIKTITKANAFKITPAQWTVAQDAAIARGDISEAQRLRDLHFKVSAPNTQIKDIQYHGSKGNAKFNVFDPKLIGQTDQGWAGRGYYFTPAKDYAKMYGSEPRAFYINAKKVHDGTSSNYFGREDSPAAEVFKRIRKKHGVDVQPILDDLISSDAIRTSFKQTKPYNDTFEEVVTRNNNQMKLADAITYDDKGIRIPLGERDNFNSNDIRYALMPFIVGGTGYGIYNRGKKRNGGSNNIGSYKRSIEDAGKISDEEYYNIMEEVAERNYKDWGLPNPDAAILQALNDNSYNYRGYYNKYPNGNGNAKDHWTDEFKTVYHPTFSDESIYSGKKSQYNPDGLNGGYWIGEVFMPASYQRTQIGENTFRPISWQRNEKKNGGVHYKVKKGDTLSKIAKQYTGNALRYDEIAKLSNIKNPDRLEIGQNIIIPQKFLNTIKDTNLPELVVTGNKNNRLIDKIKAPNVKHEEKPNTLRVQRLRNRSISLEELNKPSFIESKLQDVKDVINESGNIQDFLQTAWNGIAKNFVEDKQVTTKKRNIKVNKNKSKDSTVLDENFAKEIRNGTDTLAWDKVPIDRTGNKYYIQESYPITENMRFGARNRGEYTPLNSNNAPLTTYRPLVKYENNKTGAVDGEGHQNHFYGFDKEGKFKVGPLSKFGPGDTMTQAFYFDVVKVKRDKNGNIVYKEDISNPGRFQPVVEGYDENTYDKNGKLKRGVYKESVITTMSKKRSLDGSYGNVSGGRVLLKCDNEIRVVSGSIEHVIQELELMQKNHKGKPVRYYQLDNGSYNRGLRTRNGKNISEQDLRDYDKQNTTAAGGGHFMYIRK